MKTTYIDAESLEHDILVSAQASLTASANLIGFSVIFFQARHIT
jgi:hypothetical protein